jgi:uncharacterized protein (UPF0332 family)
VTEQVAALLDLAAQSIDGAKWLMQGNMPRFAVSRAYYAMFYIAEALLLHKGLKYG